MLTTKLLKKSNTGRVKVASSIETALTTGPTTTFVYAGQMNDTWSISPGVQMILSNAGVTPSDYRTILSADPLARTIKDAPVTAEPLAYSGTRFVPLRRLDGTAVKFDYVPVPIPGMDPSIGTEALSKQIAETVSSGEEVTYSVSASQDGSYTWMAMLTLAATTTGKYTWGHSNTTETTDGSTFASTLAVSQPDYGWLGPAKIAVYVDTVFKTYMFNLEWY